MILLLGKSKNIGTYLSENIHQEDKIIFCPEPDVHFSEFPNIINEIKEYNPSVIVSHNMEFIDCLLSSDLEFDVTTVREDINNITLLPYFTRTLSKQEAYELREKYEMELRI